METLPVMLEDMGVMMKLQVALEGAHREKEAQDQKLESPRSVCAVELSSEMLRLQDLVIEGFKMLENTMMLRTFVMDGYSDYVAEREHFQIVMWISDS